MLNLATFQPPPGAPNRSMVPTIAQSQPATSTPPTPTCTYAKQNQNTVLPMHSLHDGTSEDAATRMQTAPAINDYNQGRNSSIVSSDQPTISSTFRLTSGPFDQTLPAVEPTSSVAQRNDHFPHGANAWHPEIESAVEMKQSNIDSSSNNHTAKPLGIATDLNQDGTEGKSGDNDEAFDVNLSSKETKRQEQVLVILSQLLT